MKRILKYLKPQSSWHFLLCLFLFCRWFFTGYDLYLVLAAISGYGSLIVAHIEYLIRTLSQAIKDSK